MRNISIDNNSICCFPSLCVLSAIEAVTETKTTLVRSRKPRETTSRLLIVSYDNEGKQKKKNNC
jgi:hypothetical protein